MLFNKIPTLLLTQTRLLLNRFPANTTPLKLPRALTRSYTDSYTNPDPSLRLKREEFSPPCKLCLIPESWFSMFHQKTGVTGLYTFFVTFGTYLISKEIYVLDHEFYSCLSMFVTCCFMVKVVGPEITKWIDRGIEKIEKDWNTNRNVNIQNIKESIDNEEELQWSKDGEVMLIAAKRENVLMQLEYNFRKRQMKVYRKLVHLLEYQVVLDNINKKYLRKNLVEWITTQVMKELTPEREAKTFEACLVEIELAAQAIVKKEAIAAADKEKKDK